MLSKDVKKSLVRGLSDRLAIHKFKYASKSSSFRREIGPATHILTLLYLPAPFGADVQPMLGMKFHDIENIYHQVVVKKLEYFDGTRTIDNNLFKIGHFLKTNSSKDIGGNDYFPVKNEGDIELMISVVFARFEEIALPYFEANNSIKRVDDLLNGNPRDLSIHNWLYPMRACMGLIAAKLNKNADYEQLLEIYDSEMARAAADYKQEFRLLKELLKSY